uniref:PPM-type phosphatase domain-containing protein n=1 Tax=Desulfobacca acetoxidans TaxID=60893 RepID=A0A7V4LCR9_9BACT
MKVMVNCEKKGSSAVAWIKGTKHKFYEDRYRLLPRAIPLVAKNNRGELFAVFDGIGSAPEGRRAAQEMADHLIKFFKEPANYSPSWEGIQQLLFEANMVIHNWGFMAGTEVPLGGCAGTVAWLFEKTLSIYHAGDTTALLIRDGQAEQLTTVHEMDDGALYRYFGLGPFLEIGVRRVQIKDFDRILLLTDGVTKVFHPLETVNIIEAHNDICRAVSDLANRSLVRGSIDDITVLLIEVDDIW